MPSLEDLLTADHLRIDGLLQSIETALGTGDAPAALAHFRAMSGSLRHHMEWEETVLFPAVPSVPRMPARHVESLKIDHERIRATLDELAGALERSRLPEARRALEDLRVFLVGHNGDEEVGIYREADRILGEEEKLRMAKSFGVTPER